MNRAYQFYLHGQFVKFCKKIAVFLVIILIFLAIVHLIGQHFNGSNKKAQEQLSKIEMSSYRSANLGANKDATNNAFNNLSVVRRTNKETGRQYVIEFLTKEVEKTGLSNFVIENVSDKSEAISKYYNDLTQMPNIHLVEVVVTFNSILHHQLEDFLQTIASSVNGAVVWQDIQTKKVVQSVTPDTLEAINEGKKVAMLGHRVVIHWFFIK